MDLFLAIMALGGILAVIGGGIFILITVWSVFFGKPLVAGDTDGVPQGVHTPIKHRADVDIENERLHGVESGAMGPAPGTLVLVLVFLAAFITYYFVNWKLLSVVWKVG